MSNLLNDQECESKEHLSALKLSNFWNDLLYSNDNNENNQLRHNTANALTLLTANCVQELQENESTNSLRHNKGSNLMQELINKVNQLQEYAIEDFNLREENERLRHALHYKASELEILLDNQLSTQRTNEQVAMEIEDYQSHAR